jgi:hypothetical protein
LSQGQSTCIDPTKTPSPAWSDDEDTDITRSASDNQAAPHPPQHAPPSDDAEASPGSLLHAAWWPPLIPLVEEPPSQAAACPANAGDLIDRALFHAEKTATCRPGAPLPPSARDDRLLWPGGAAAAGAVGWGFVGRLGASLPGPWDIGPESYFNFAPRLPRVAAPTAADGVDAAHPGASHVAWAAAGGAESAADRQWEAAQAAELGQRRWGRFALLAAGGPADEAEDGARLCWEWGAPGWEPPGWAGAECACPV